MTRCCPHCGGALDAAPAFEVCADPRTARRGHRAAYLSVNEWRMLQLLKARGAEPTSVERLQKEILAGTHARRLIWSLRGKLAPMGVQIVCVRATGYRLVIGRAPK